MDKHNSLLYYKLNPTRTKCYKTFYTCNLRLFSNKLEFCHWQAFPAYITLCWKGLPETKALAYYEHL
jgi:hypothetical protein